MTYGVRYGLYQVPYEKIGVQAATTAGSDLDALHDFDRVRQPNGSCFSVYGGNTFFTRQNTGMLAWVNASNSAFHGGELVLRRAATSGWGHRG